MHGHSMYDMDDDKSDDNLESLNDASNYNSRIDIEYAQYWQHKVTEVEKQTCEVNGEFRVLIWWKRFGVTRFLIMACIARFILVVPASSAMSENNFSYADNTLTKKHNRLKSRVVNDLLFLRSNRDICRGNYFINGVFSHNYLRAGGWVCVGTAWWSWEWVGLRGREVNVGEHGWAKPARA